MESSRSKRRRLMLSYISSRPRPDLPAIFESLNDDTLTTVFEFVGDKSYKSFGGVNKHCKDIYLSSGMTKKTFLYGYGTLQAIVQDIRERSDMAYNLAKGVVLYNRGDVLDWTLQERRTNLLRAICEVAAEEGKTDLLVEVLNNLEDEGDKRYVFYQLDYHAAKNGHLNVLEWIEEMELSIDKYLCLKRAAEGGHIQILQWLKEEQGLELDGGLYYHAIDGGGQLHVIKWLREQEVDWDKWTFYNAARKGNLDVLQWLHDEGCTWPENDDDDYYHRVYEDKVKPEILDWLRANGYADRIYNND